MQPIPQCDTSVFVNYNCLFSENEVLPGAYESIKEIIGLVGVENFYVVDGNHRKPWVNKMLKLFKFWKETGANPDNLIFFDIDEEHGQFNAIRRKAGNKKALCVICNDYKVLQKFPRETVRVLINHDTEEWRSVERDVLAYLSIEDAKVWDTLLVTPSWNVHQSLVRIFIKHPERMMQKV